MRRVRVIVRGRVQGVGYRNWSYSRAKLARLTGYVRNLPGGEVEVTAEGDEPVLQDLVTQLRSGPPLARVTEVEAAWSDVTQPEFSGFDIRR